MHEGHPQEGPEREVQQRSSSVIKKPGCDVLAGVENAERLHHWTSIAPDQDDVRPDEHRHGGWQG